MDDFETLARARVERGATDGEPLVIVCDGCRDANFRETATAMREGHLPFGWRWLDLRCHGSRSALILCPDCAMARDGYDLDACDEVRMVDDALAAMQDVADKLEAVGLPDLGRQLREQVGNVRTSMHRISQFGARGDPFAALICRWLGGTFVKHDGATWCSPISAGDGTGDAPPQREDTP